MSRPVRVLISKIGLDGHDRGAKLIVRALRDAGMEVIYTGLWQTPATTVAAALQEDVDVLGVSLLSAAHMTVMPEVIRQCREAGLDELPVIVGGIIPEDDHPPLREAGCAAVFNPGTPMQTIVETLRELSDEYRRKRSKQAPPEITTQAGLARAITQVIEGTRAKQASPQAAGSIAVGVTGAPGVGKSTLIGKLAKALREEGRKVGVIAVDPTSPITGGSLLGDRLRMMGSEPDDRLFVRSLSSSGQAGGLAPKTAEVADLLKAAGFEVILIETVGAGQNDVEVRTVSDEVLLLLMPGSGDAVQFEKAGVFEVATGFLVNKSDLPGVDKTVRDLRDSIADERPVWAVSALRGEGLDALAGWIMERCANDE